jgi:hypothetical protein
MHALGNTKTFGPGHYRITDREVIEMIHNPARGRRPLFSRFKFIQLLDIFALGWPCYYLNDYYSTVVNYEVKKYIISNDDVPYEGKKDGE